MQLATRNQGERLWKASAHARRRDAPPRGGFTEAERFGAVREQGRKPEVEVQPSLVAFGEMREQVCGHTSVLTDEVRQRCQERVVSQRPELKTIRHASRIARGFSRPENPSRVCFGARNASV